MENNILISISLEEFEAIQKGWIREVLDEKTTSSEKSTDYLTRKETSELLKVSLPTLHFWTKKGIIKAYRINSRIRYKRGDIEEALSEVQSIKYRRR